MKPLFSPYLGTQRFSVRKMFRLRLVRFNSTHSEEKLRKIIESSSIKSPPKPVSSIPIPPIQKNREINEKQLLDFEKFRVDLKSKIEDLPSQKEALRNNVTKNLSNYMESFQQAIFKATRTLNDVTGYSSIEKLRSDVEELENNLKSAKNEVTKAKEAYSQAIQIRSQLQKDINELLTRKHNWDAQDLENFTTLYRNDHTNEQNEVNAQQKLDELESLVDSIQVKLTQSILTRYHEEQIWSDKIRRASTWGTWLLMGFNIMLFFTATFIVEPWKRRRMVDSFDEKVKTALLALKEGDTKALTPLTPSSLVSSEPTKDVFNVTLPVNSWESFKKGILTTYHAIVNPEITDLNFNKTELGWLFSIFTLFATSLGSLITFYFK